MSSAKQIISEIERKGGGVVSVVSLSDTPRDRQPIINFGECKEEKNT